MIDTGAGSFASFAAALVANRYFPDTATIGLFGLFFSGFVVASVAPAQLILIPAEVRLLSAPPARQAAAVPSALRKGGVVALAAAAAMGVVVSAIAPLVSDEVAWRQVVPLALSASAFTLLSPLQDHVRRMAHQLGRSSWAAVVSLVQLATVVAVVGLFLLADRGLLWAPFGALAIANVCSAGVGLVLLRRLAQGAEPAVVPLGELLHSGRWLLVSGSLDQLFGFLGLLALGLLASIEAGGEYEVSRQLSQPLYVVAASLTTVLRPRSMHAALTRDRREARRVSHLYLAVVVGAGVAYAALFGFRWALNPLPELFPRSYERTGLLAVFVIGTLFNNVTGVFRNELVGGGFERGLLRISLVAGVSHLAGVMVLAPAFGAFAIPLALIALRPLEFFAYWRSLRAMYATPAPPTPAELGERGHERPTEPGEGAGALNVGPRLAPPPTRTIG
ncbi:MAG: lipopolysaccharide biosynthesis protein [Acidimicrobiales bacterium]